VAVALGTEPNPALLLRYVTVHPVFNYSLPRNPHAISPWILQSVASLSRPSTALSFLTRRSLPRSVSLSSVLRFPCRPFSSSQSPSSCRLTILRAPPQSPTPPSTQVLGSSLGVSLGSPPAVQGNDLRSFSFARSFGPSLSPSSSPRQPPASPRGIAAPPASPHQLPRILSTDDVVRSLEEHTHSPRSQGSRRLSEQPLDCTELSNDITLPFSDRPSEIRELCDLPQNRPLFNLVRSTLSSFDLDKHVALTREELDDREWVERLRRVTQPRSEFLWGRLELVLGLWASHYDPEHAPEDEQHTTVERVYSNESVLNIDPGLLSPTSEAAPPVSPLFLGSFSPDSCSPRPRSNRHHRRSGSSVSPCFMECIDEVSATQEEPAKPRAADEECMVGSLSHEPELSEESQERYPVGVRLTAEMPESAIDSESEGTPSGERARTLGPGLKFTFGAGPATPWKSVTVT
jgi:hypothetical protein